MHDNRPIPEIGRLTRLCRQVEVIVPRFKSLMIRRDDGPVFPAQVADLASLWARHVAGGLVPASVRVEGFTGLVAVAVCGDRVLVDVVCCACCVCQ